MKDQKKAEEIAAQRMQLILPLLDEGLDNARARQIRLGICEQWGTSERTLRRYIARYKSDGFAGLKPAPKGRGTPNDGISPYIVEQAVLLRRQVPGRSVSQIIQILEWEGLAEPGQVKRSTLQDRLSQRGYSARHMRMYAETGAAARRYQKRHRNQLWHSDIKYGPYLPIGKDGGKKQVYLVTFMDDATRFILHGQFYPMLDQVIVENSFRRAVMQHGVPERVFFDNGSQYRTKWMNRACAKMGIRLMFARPYSPEATGKIERFNSVVDSFLRECDLEKPRTLDQLNELFEVWLEECYQRKQHSALDGNVSPFTAYRGDVKPLRFLDPEIIADAFLHSEKRKVDKSGCISFAGKKYEVGLNFIGHRVDVIYDPSDISELSIECEGHKPFRIRELVIGEHSGKKPRLPEHLLKEPAGSSRLLKAAATRNNKRVGIPSVAVSYKSLGEEGGDHV